MNQRATLAMTTTGLTVGLSASDPLAQTKGAQRAPLWRRPSQSNVKQTTQPGMPTMSKFLSALSETANIYLLAFIVGLAGYANAEPMSKQELDKLNATIAGSASLGSGSYPPRALIWQRRLLEI